MGEGLRLLLEVQSSKILSEVREKDHLLIIVQHACMADFNYVQMFLVPPCRLACLLEHVLHVYPNRKTFAV